MILQMGIWQGLPAHQDDNFPLFYHTNIDKQNVFVMLRDEKVLLALQRDGHMYDEEVSLTEFEWNELNVIVTEMFRNRKENKNGSA